MHLLICLMHETAIYFRGLFFGFKKYEDKRTMILVRSQDENVLPAMIIWIVISFIGEIAFFAVEASYQNKPNNFDIVISAIDNTQTYEAPTLKKAPETEKT
jgi:hypothetical protein